MKHSTSINLVLTLNVKNLSFLLSNNYIVKKPINLEKLEKLNEKQAFKVNSYYKYKFIYKK